jgi:hypothetical protein
MVVGGRSAGVGAMAEPYAIAAAVGDCLDAEQQDLGAKDNAFPVAVSDK